MSESLPKTIEVRMLQAFDRLVGAAVDIPATWLEGFSDDIRNTNEARLQLKNKTVELIIGKLGTDDPLALRAFSKNASKILGNQVKMEEIVGYAINDISGTSAEIKEENKEIDEDWFNNFEAEALKKSSSEMKLIFSKILAGEILKPGSFSISALRSLGAMSDKTANIFLTAASLVSDNIMIFSMHGNAGHNALESYGLDFVSLTVLNECGLIIPDFNSYVTLSIAAEGSDFNYAGATHFLKPNTEDVNLKIKVHGVRLTTVGQELLSIVELNENKDYSEALSAFFSKRGFKLSVA